MGRRDEVYDDDVFSLEEDLNRERRKQWIQYLLVALCAVLLIAAALYGSVVLTRRRVAEQSAAALLAQGGASENGGIAITDPVTGTEGEGTVGQAIEPAVEINTDYWPGDAFPAVPVFESQAYDTAEKPGWAEISVPSSAAQGFNDYIDQLTERGAAIFIRTTRLSVLMLGDTEIHVVSGNLQNKIALANERAYIWNEPTYAAFQLPTTGRLVQVAEGVGAGSRVLTYRGAMGIDALEYAHDLIERGWTISGSLEPSNNIFLAVFKKNNLQITIDYFSTGDNYLVKLDYLS